MSLRLWNFVVCGVFFLMLFRIGTPLFFWPTAWHVVGAGAVVVGLLLFPVIFFARRVRSRER